MQAWEEEDGGQNPQDISFQGAWAMTKIKQNKINLGREAQLGILPGAQCQLSAALLKWMRPQQKDSTEEHILVSSLMKVQEW